MTRLFAVAALTLSFVLPFAVPASASTPAAHPRAYVLHPTGQPGKWGRSFRPGHFNVTSGPPAEVRRIRWIRYTSSGATGRGHLVACDVGCFGPHGRITFRLYRVRLNHHVRYFTRLHFDRVSPGIEHNWHWSWSAAEWQPQIP
jgi:hypothetical protein